MKTDYSPLWRFMPWALLSAIGVGVVVHVDFGRGGKAAMVITWCAWWIAGNVADEVWRSRQTPLGLPDTRKLSDEPKRQRVGVPEGATIVRRGDSAVFEPRR